MFHHFDINEISLILNIFTIHLTSLWGFYCVYEYVSFVGICTYLQRSCRSAQICKDRKPGVTAYSGFERFLMKRARTGFTPRPFQRHKASVEQLDKFVGCISIVLGARKVGSKEIPFSARSLVNKIN